MGQKLSDIAKDIDDFDPDEPSFAERCQARYPKRTRVVTILTWLAFLAFVAVSITNYILNAREAQAVLTEHKQVMAEVVAVDDVYNDDGELEEYLMDLGYSVSGQSYELQLELDPDEVDAALLDAEQVELIYGPDAPAGANQRSYFERRADFTANWLGIAFGYLIVLILCFILRFVLLKLICPGAGDETETQSKEA